MPMRVEVEPTPTRSKTRANYSTYWTPVQLPVSAIRCTASHFLLSAFERVPRYVSALTTRKTLQNGYMGMFAHLYPDIKCPRVLNLNAIPEHMPWPMDRKALAHIMPTIEAGPLHISCQLYAHPKRIPTVMHPKRIPTVMHPPRIPKVILQDPCQLTNCKNRARKYWKPGIILALQESCHIVGMELARGGTSFPPLPPLLLYPGGALNDGVFLAPFYY